MSEQAHALIEQRGHVLIVTMNRPQARNALSPSMMALMRQAWDRVDADPGIRVCVLTGAGGAFCAGADLKAMTSDHPGSRLGDVDLSVIEPLLKGRRLTKPLIAAVEGPAIAGGTEILQACDIRVAGESARFGVSEARWGLFPLGGSAAAPDPLHPRRRPAADRAAHPGGGGAVDGADRPRRAGRAGPGQGA
jgi:enoyl-CoA hydratase